MGKANSNHGELIKCEWLKKFSFAIHGLDENKSLKDILFTSNIHVAIHSICSLSSTFIMNKALESAFHQMHFLESGIKSSWTSQEFDTNL